MKHYVKPECKHKCKFIQISDELWLCPHASYGRLSYMRGAVEEARALLERAGGYHAVLAKLAKDDDERRVAAHKERREHGEPAVRYG